MVVKVLVLLLALLVAGALVTVVRAEARATRAEAAFPPLGSFVTIDGARIHYVQAGSGPDLILLHGAGGNIRDFTHQLMGQVTDRYRVTVFDRPGQGYSDQVPGTPTGPFATTAESPQAQAAFLRAAAAKLGINRPIIAGHSFGGIVAMAWALEGLDEDRPINASAIVSFAGVLMPWPGELGPYYKVNGSALGGAFLVPLICAFATEGQIENAITNTFAPQAAVPGYLAHIGGPLALRIGNFRANVRQVNTLRPHVVEMAKGYGALTLPIEILHGTADETVPLDVHAGPFAARVSSAHLTPLDGVGHQPHQVDMPAAIAAIDRAAARAGLR